MSSHPPSQFSQYARIEGFSERIPLVNLRKVLGDKIDLHFVYAAQNGDKFYEVVRPKAATQALIDYALSGKLHIPNSICVGLFTEELEYWGIPLYELERCCFHEYKQFQSNLKDIKGFESMVEKERKLFSNAQETKRSKIWAIVDRRSMTVVEKIYSILSIFCIILAGFNTTLMTIDDPLHPLTSQGSHQVSIENATNSTNFNPDTRDSPEQGISKSNPNADIMKITCRPCNCVDADYLISEILFEFKDTCGNMLDFFVKFLTQTDILIPPPPPNHSDSNDFIDENYDLLHDTPDYYSIKQPVEDLDQHSVENDTIYADIREPPPDHLLQNDAIDIQLMNTSMDSFSRQCNSSCNTTANDTLSDANFKTVHMDGDLLVKAKIENALDNIKMKAPIVHSMTAFGDWRYFDFIELITTAFFAVEIVLRIYSCPDYKTFFTKFLNILEILLVLTQILRYAIVYHIDEEGKRNELKSQLEIITFFQILRIFRLVRVIDNVMAFKVLKYSFKTGKKDLGVLLLYVFVGMLILGNFIYYVEDTETFPSIPAAYYWSIITMTTVGYGDMAPKNPIGKVIACFGALLGLLLFSLVVPIVVGTFLQVYENARSMRSVEENEKYRNKQDAMRHINVGEKENLTTKKLEFEIKVTEH